MSGVTPSWSADPFYWIHSDKGLKLETSVLESFMVAN